MLVQRANLNRLHKNKASKSCRTAFGATCSPSGGAHLPNVINVKDGRWFQKVTPSAIRGAKPPGPALRAVFGLRDRATPVPAGNGDSSVLRLETPRCDSDAAR